MQEEKAWQAQQQQQRHHLPLQQQEGERASARGSRPVARMWKSSERADGSQVHVNLNLHEIGPSVVPFL